MVGFLFRLVLGYGLVQFGEFVDSIAEFFLDVADTVLDGLSALALRGYLLIDTGDFAYKSAGLPGLMLVTCIVKFGGFLRIRDARVVTAMIAIGGSV